MPDDDWWPTAARKQSTAQLLALSDGPSRVQRDDVDSASNVAELMWKAFEPYHAVVYFSPAALEAIAAPGLRGFWRGYFATRAAPLGTAPAETVAAVFFNFHPDMVRKAIPHVWDLVTPAQAWGARVEGADRALRSALGDWVGSPDVRNAAAAARRATDRCDLVGRALFAAHVDLAWPAEPHLALWHAATLLREHRGDGHVAALVAAGFDGCETHVMADAAATVVRSQTQKNRGWSDDEWAAAAARLAERGLIEAGGSLTPRGRSVWTEVAVATNRAASGPWSVADVSADGLYDTWRQLSNALYDGAVVPLPNPIGVTRAAT